MRILMITFGLMLVTPSTNGDEAPLATKVCSDDQQRCTEACGLERILWFYEGEAYDNCMQQCEEEVDACLAVRLDVDRFEVILPRSAYGDRDVVEKPALEEYDERLR